MIIVCERNVMFLYLSKLFESKALTIKDLIGRDPKRVASAADREMIWKMQGGRCGKCHEPMTRAGMEVHHFYQHAFGGGSNFPNMMGLHKKCHAEITKGQASLRKEFKGYGGF
jgi:5-methylcytosine-specific restriction endonuclease McrA